VSYTSASFYGRDAVLDLREQTPYLSYYLASLGMPPIKRKSPGPRSIVVEGRTLFDHLWDELRHPFRRPK
jgi:hypothetical protein